MELTAPPRLHRYTLCSPLRAGARCPGLMRDRETVRPGHEAGRSHQSRWAETPLAVGP